MSSSSYGSVQKFYRGRTEKVGFSEKTDVCTDDSVCKNCECFSETSWAESKVNFSGELRDKSKITQYQKRNH